MATAGDASKFEMACNDGITCNDAARGAGFIDNISENVSHIADMAKDRFYADDSKTISASIDEFKEMDEKIDKTNILYERYPEKKELMQKILEEMETYKTEMMSIDPTTYGDACVKYNDNLEAAKLACYKDDILQSTEEYNRNPLPLTERVSYSYHYKKNTENKWHDVTEEVTVGKIDVHTQVWTPVENIANEINVNKRNNKGKYDYRSIKEGSVVKQLKISTDGIDKSRNDNIKGSDKSKLASEYSFLQKELKKALRTWPEVSQIEGNINRPSGSSSYKI